MRCSCHSFKASVPFLRERLGGVLGTTRGSAVSRLDGCFFQAQKNTQILCLTRLAASLADWWPGDTAGLVAFVDLPAVYLPLTHCHDPVRLKLGSVGPSGRTMLSDGMEEGLRRLKSAKQPLQIRVVVSAVGDNIIRLTEHELRRIALEADAQVSVIAIHRDVIELGAVVQESSHVKTAQVYWRYRYNSWVAD